MRTVNIDTTDIYLDADVTRPGFEVAADVEPGDSGAVVVHRRRGRRHHLGTQHRAATIEPGRSTSPT